MLESPLEPVPLNGRMGRVLDTEGRPSESAKAMEVMLAPADGHALMCCSSRYLILKKLKL